MIFDKNMDETTNNENFMKYPPNSNPPKVLVTSGILKNDFGYIIYNKDTGKTLKSIKYTPANFDCLLNQ